VDRGNVCKSKAKIAEDIGKIVQPTVIVTAMPLQHSMLIR